MHAPDHAPQWCRALLAPTATLGQPALLLGLLCGGDVGRLLMATGVLYVMMSLAHSPRMAQRTHRQQGEKSILVGS
ncbi:hypothetical protein [Nannocystis pusilla]|uniref:hypothetical protein n=1 Tax=Nannocystis pusilla TaxID=889268 RepID=UPI003BF3501C